MNPELELNAMPKNKMAKQQWQELARACSTSAEQKLVATMRINGKKHYMLPTGHWTKNGPEARLFMSQAMFFKACSARLTMISQMPESSLYASFLETQRGVRPWGQVLKQDIAYESMNQLSRSTVRAYVLSLILQDPYDLQKSIVRFHAEHTNKTFRDARVELTKKVTDDYIRTGRSGVIKLMMLEMLQNRGAYA